MKRFYEWIRMRGSIFCLFRRIILRLGVVCKWPISFVSRESLCSWEGPFWFISDPRSIWYILLNIWPRTNELWCGAIRNKWWKPLNFSSKTKGEFRWDRDLMSKRRIILRTRSTLMAFRIIGKLQESDRKRRFR